MSATSPSTGEEQTSESTRRAALRQYAGVLLTLYWLAMFLATHVPVPKLPAEAAGADKLVHLLGYGGLGLLFAFWTALRRRLTALVVLSLWGIIAAYGVLDEWLQQFVNRTTDLGDWTADVTGAAIGVGLVWLLQSLRPLDAQTPRDEPA